MLVVKIPGKQWEYLRTAFGWKTAARLNTAADPLTRAANAQLLNGAFIHAARFVKNLPPLQGSRTSPSLAHISWKFFYYLYFQDYWYLLTVKAYFLFLLLLLLLLLIIIIIIIIIIMNTC